MKVMKWKLFTIGKCINFKINFKISIISRVIFMQINFILKLDTLEIYKLFFCKDP